MAVGEDNVIKDFKVKNTRIKICDDYCRDRLSADVEAILTRVARKAQEQLSAQAAADRGNKNHEYD